MSDASRKNILLVVLYLSFISLGLPDSILGVAWPDMRLAFGKPLEFAGLLLSLTTILSVVSSLASGFFINRLGTGMLIAVCACMTASAMFGYALAGGIGALLLFTLFFGLGQGAVDTAVNAYMSRHYSARHMNWVHCCWGMGATGGPLIITAAFSLDLSWRAGYAAIGFIQVALALVFFLSLRLWKQNRTNEAGAANKEPGIARNAAKELPRGRLIAVSGAGIAFYFLYPGIELVTGLWGASYLVEQMGATPAAAGISVSMFWGCLAAGRFLAGFPAARWSNAAIIRAGLAVAAAGGAIILVTSDLWLCRAALMLVGLGIAPLYPTMMHDAPRRVGGAHGDKLVGFQVGSALAGAAVIPAAVGLLARHASLAAFGPALCLFICLVLAAHEISLRGSLLRGEKRL